ncbi:hypothetical protein C8Q77DRAFT_712593 [Trametes polyzona]|nr:hypothetical protein C8Q77DRAFT_712593 [Trametes polyzona]
MSRNRPSPDLVTSDLEDCRSDSVYPASSPRTPTPEPYTRSAPACTPRAHPGPRGRFPPSITDHLPRTTNTPPSATVDDDQHGPLTPAILDTMDQQSDSSITEPEDDPINDAYCVGCHDGRINGRRETLAMFGMNGQDAARDAAATVLAMSADDPDESLSGSPPVRIAHGLGNVCMGLIFPATQSYIPFPNMLVGCKLTPKSRKRIARELPPSPQLGRRFERPKLE